MKTSGPDFSEATLSFPDPRLARADGLVAVGGELSIPRLLLAYRSGIFPWSAHPVTWWSPDPRGVFELGNLHRPRSLQRALRKKAFRVTFDTAFEQVIRACSAVERREGATWISPLFVEAYCAFALAGYAHSVECWQGDELVGGLYGVAIGGLFAGESMFHRVDDASKVALVHLESHLVRRGYQLFDTQMVTSTTRALGAREISRDLYLNQVAGVVDQSCTFLTP